MDGYPFAFFPTADRWSGLAEAGDKAKTFFAWSRHNGAGNLSVNSAMLDGHADTLYQVMNEASVTAGGTEDTDVSLLLDLMKLPSIEQNQDAMDVIDRYLIQQGITRVNYSAAQADLFDVAPADQTKTILPVLIRDGAILNRGFACTKMEGM